MAETVLLRGATVNCNTIPSICNNGRVCYIHNAGPAAVLVTQSTGAGNASPNTIIGTITLSSGNGAACQVTLIKDMSDQLYSNAASGCTMVPIGYTT